MESLAVECLRCGAVRSWARSEARCIQQDDCPRCSYVGWAVSTELSERARGELREWTVEERRVHATGVEQRNPLPAMKPAVAAGVLTAQPASADRGADGAVAPGLPVAQRHV